MQVWPKHQKIDTDDFIEGNSIFIAPTSEPSLSYAFRARDTKLRLQDAKNIMDNELNNFEGALNDAIKQTKEIINQHYTVKEEAELMIKALEEKCEGILENYNTLKEGIPQALAALSTPSS